MGMMQEFKDFAAKGNVVDLAVGVIIGAAFGKIVDSLVEDVVMPMVAFLTGGKLDFVNSFVALGTVPAGTANTLAAMREAGVAVFAWGNFVTTVFNFVILAFVVFLMVKQINTMRKGTPAEAETPENLLLLREIRDSLKK